MLRVYALCVPFQLLSQEEIPHCLALVWPARAPQQACVVVVIAITIVAAAQPRTVFRITCDLLAGARARG